MSFKNSLHKRRNRKVTDDLEVKASVQKTDKKRRPLTDHKLLQMVMDNPEEDREEFYE